MKDTSLLHLDDLRERRDRRLRMIAALLAPAPERKSAVADLEAAADRDGVGAFGTAP